MSQPLPSETIEYERYVDGMRAENAAIKGHLRAAILQCKRHNEEYHHFTPTEQLSEWEAFIDNKAPPKIITIRIEGGMVQEITGIPAGYEVRVEDYDHADDAQPTWDVEKKCHVTVYGGDV